MRQILGMISLSLVLFLTACTTSEPLLRPLEAGPMVNAATTAGTGGEAPESSSTDASAREEAAATATLLFPTATAAPPGLTVTATPESPLLTLYRFDNAAPTGQWYIVNDTVMGGVSQSSLGLSDAGTLLFTGNVSLENNGGFASTRSAAAEYGITDEQGIRLTFRGDGELYRFELYSYANPNITYEAPFQTDAQGDGGWKTVDLPFADFVPTIRSRVLANAPALDPVTIGAVGIMIRDGHQGPFALEIAAIEAYE